LINTYGSTETTLVTHATDLHGPIASSINSGIANAGITENKVPIGKCLPHVVEHITEAGELLIGGPSVADGYLNLPEQTAERFVLMGEGSAAKRYYRTGDGVSRNSAGELVHQGRLDGELKIRGIRVNPGEVESEIFGHPQVSMAAVVGVKTADHNSLVAYVVPRQVAGVETLGDDVLAYLRLRLPKHLVPAKINVVAELAYTSSGKIDRAMTHQRHAIQLK
jgi:nonribosomal peptide synthetase protein VioO